LSVSSGVTAFRFIEHSDGLVKVIRRQVSVSLRHLDVMVAEQFRNGVQVNPSHHQPACKRVAQVVPAEVLNTRLD
jgi:hypothetical protein